MAKKKIKAGIRISITFIGLMLLYIFFTSLGNLISEWQFNNAMILLIISGVLIIIGISIGIIKISKMKNGFRGIFQ